jgi:hypothetical protein
LNRRAEAIRCSKAALLKGGPPTGNRAMVEPAAKRPFPSTASALQKECGKYREEYPGSVRQIQIENRSVCSRICECLKPTSLIEDIYWQVMDADPPFDRSDLTLPLSIEMF